MIKEILFCFQFIDGKYIKFDKLAETFQLLEKVNSCV